MTTQRPFRIFAGILALGIVATSWTTVAAQRPARSGERQVLTGELVVTSPAAHRFRLVNRPGMFTAPKGMSLKGFEGRPVEVEIGRDGRVVSITLIEVPIAPITHEVELLSGELTVRDLNLRTFGIAGDPRTLVAPAGIDIERYAGRTVELRLDADGRVTGLTAKAHAGDALASRPPRDCTQRGATIANGATVCRHGTLHRCADGEWVPTLESCR